jgi:hypothetical protein
MLRIGRVSVTTRSCLLGPTGILVSIWLPVPSVLSACYCLDRYCVFKSLATSGYDKIISSASIIKIYIYTCLLRATLEDKIEVDRDSNITSRRQRD